MQSVKFVKGNIFAKKVVAIVNPVNCVGVMGAGLAKEFKVKFPNNFEQYKKDCIAKRIKIGVVTSFEEGGKLIYNLPTKQHWKNPSTLDYIETGLAGLVTQLNKDKPSSVAIPALGCGLGGLDWNTVKAVLVEQLLHGVKYPVIFYIFEPQ